MGDIWVDIWHTPDEKPEMRDLVIVHRKQCGDTRVCSVYPGDVEIVWRLNNIIQWAYADDFLQSIGIDDEPTSNP
jgi:hypothetical protein